MLELNQVHCGDCIEVMKEMDAESVDCCVTSPPYWGLRDYSLPPQIWDGVEGCVHEWGDETIKQKGGLGQQKGLKGNTHIAETWDAAQTITQGQFCQLCGAWRGSLGLEPTPELFISHLVQVFREVKRVLKDSGTLWVNIGDSYAASGGSGSGEYQ